jgi:hypothetical protein
MDMSKREDKLQRYRSQRQPTPAPSMGSNPTHWPKCPTRTRDHVPLRLIRNGTETNALLRTAQLDRAVAAM